MKLLSKFLSLLIFGICPSIHAQFSQPGELDTTFNFGKPHSFFANPNNPLPGQGANSSILATTLQPDGKVLIGGDFTNYNGWSINHIARLNANGTLDASFNPGTGPAGVPFPNVRAMALQPDGKILIGGNFTSYNGVPRNRIARLNSDGSLDVSFNPGTGANSDILSLVLQTDGKIIIGGGFTDFNGTAINRIARINADGSLDATFNPGTGTNATVLSLGLQPDGKIIVVGSFTSYNGGTINRIARLNADGSLDATFNPGTGANSTVRSLYLQPDGKIFIVGDFTTFNGTARNYITRLNSDGSLDATFDPGTGAISSIESLTLQPDGKLIIGGGFASYNGTTINFIARVDSDGSLDATFNPGTGANSTGTIRSLSLQPDGKILVGGAFTRFDGTAQSRITRLNPNGTVDATFNPDTGANGAAGPVRSIAIQPDGKMLIGGDFVSVNAKARRMIARLNVEGTLDATFDPGTGANSTVAVVALQPDGNILVGGGFTDFNGTAINRIVRLNANGTLDATFNPGTGANFPVLSIALQPDGKILIGGSFSTINGVSRNSIARLNADGSLDASFNPGTGALGIQYLALQPDGKVLIGGSFTSYNSTTQNRIARLNADGSLDATFNIGTGVNGVVFTLALQPDGKILIGGDLTSYNGTAVNDLARLNSDGSLDGTFNPGTGPAGIPFPSIRALTVQSDGKILIGGNFTSFNGTPRNHISRIDASGSLDATFNPGVGANSDIWSIGLQTGGKVLIGGNFTSYNNIGRSRVARILESPAAAVPSITSFTPTSGPVGTTVTMTGTNFSATPLNNIVYFGATRANVTAATETQLSVTVPPGSTHQPITVQVNALIATAPAPFVVTTPVHALNNCSFAPRIDVTVGGNPTTVAVADIDEDGKPDVISASRSTNQLTIFLNTSVVGTIDAGTLDAPYLKPTGGSPYAVVAEDLDGDGKRDIAVSNAGSASISVFRNTSTPGIISFDNRFDYPAGFDPVHINAQDLDGDGKPDLVAANRLSNSLSVYKNTSVPGGFNASSFAPHVQFATGAEPYIVEIADLNVDGKPELVVSNSVSQTVTVFQNQTPAGVLNSSSFSTAATLPTGILPIGIALEDLDSDGKPDIIVGNHNDTFFSIYRNIGTGPITAASFAARLDFTAPNGVAITAPRDLNGDAKLDLLVTSIYTNVQTIWENISTPGTIDFTLRGTFATDTWPGASMFVDLDGDERPEAIVTTMVGGTLSVFKNQIGALPAPTISSMSPAAADVGVAITITGTNFDPIAGNNEVLFNGVPAIPLSSTATSISVVVPVGAITGPVTVTVNCQAVSSAFTVCSLSAPTTTDGNHCGPGTVTLLASGAVGTQEYRWYDAPVAGISQGTLAAYTTPAISATGTYYASIHDITTGCESTRAPTVANIRPVPSTPGVTGDASCVPAPLTLGASGGVNGDYRWYTVATGGAVIPGEVNDAYTTPLLTTTTTYFVALANAFCESTPRAAVTAAINTVAAPTINTTNCTATSATLDGPAGFTGYLWSTGATTPQLTVTSAGTYTLIVTSSAGCTSPSSPPVSFTSAFCNQSPTADPGTAYTTVKAPIVVAILPLLSDPDSNLDLGTLIVVGGTASGAPATLNANNELTIDYSNTSFVGTDRLTLEICDLAGVCVQFEIIIEVDGEITIFNAISPNADGKNEVFFIENIDLLPETQQNKLTLFNRWGSAVFEAVNYNNTTNTFRGLGNNGEELPSGTYFYTLEFSSGAPKRTGFISLRK